MMLENHLRLGKQKRLRQSAGGEGAAPAFGAAPFRDFLFATTSAGSSIITTDCGGTECVSQTLLPMTEPRPTTTSPPRMAAPA